MLEDDTGMRGYGHVVQKTTLENGIRVITEMIPEMRSVAIGILFDASPRDEKADQMGLAHLAEHAMFLGTSNRDGMQISRLMDIGGGNVGAFTARDYTCYFATVLDDYQPYALDLLGDLLLNSIYPSEQLEREKEVILREICAAKDSPQERVHSLLKSYVWPDHPLGRPIFGEPERVKALTREDVIYFVHENYLPNRMIISAAGNVEHSDFVAHARDAFWRMLGKGEARSHPNPIFRAGVSVQAMPVSQAYFSLGLKAYPYAHQGRYTLHVLNNLLGGGISSRLFRRMREERGLVYDIGSEYHAYHDGGLLVVEGSTAPEYLIQVLALTLLELWNLITGEEPVDDEELWKAKMNTRGQHLIASENTNTRMSRLATQEFYFGHPIPANEILDQIEAVDVQMIEDMVYEALADAFMETAIAVVGPEAPEHYCVSSVEELLVGLQQPM